MPCVIIRVEDIVSEDGEESVQVHIRREDGEAFEKDVEKASMAELSAGSMVGWFFREQGGE